MAILHPFLTKSFPISGSNLDEIRGAVDINVCVCVWGAGLLTNHVSQSCQSSFDPLCTLK